MLWPWLDCPDRKHGSSGFKNCTATRVCQTGVAKATPFHVADAAFVTKKVWPSWTVGRWQMLPFTLVPKLSLICRRSRINKAFLRQIATSISWWKPSLGPSAVLKDTKPEGYRVYCRWFAEGPVSLWGQQRNVPWSFPMKGNPLILALAFL